MGENRINSSVGLLLGTALLLAIVFSILLRTNTLANEAEKNLAALRLLENLPVEAVNTAEIQAIYENIQASEERALGYLGIFESVGLVIAVLGALLGSIGAIFAANLGMSVRDAEEKLRKSREEFTAATARIESLEKELNSKFQESIQNSSIAELLISMARQQYELGYLQGAKEIYERALQLTPETPVIPYRIAYILTQLEELDEAEAILKQALAIDTNFPNAQASLGFVYRRKGDKQNDEKQQIAYYKLAEKYLRSALLLNPHLVDDDGESWNGALAGLYRRMGREEDAIYHYRQAAHITPQSSYPKLNLLFLEWKHHRTEKLLGQLEEVEGLIKSKIKKDKDTYWDRADLMNVQLALGKDDATINESLETFLQILPPDAKDVLPRVIETTKEIGTASSFDGDKRDKNKIAEIIEKLETFAANPN